MLTLSGKGSASTLDVMMSTAQDMNTPSVVSLEILTVNTPWVLVRLSIVHHVEPLRSVSDVLVSFPHSAPEAQK